MYHAVIIGAGNIAAGFDSPHSSHILTHAHGYQQNPLFCLRGFYDKDQTKAKQAAQIWGCRAYEALDDALKGAEVISCCVPDSYHKEVLQQAAKYHPRLVITEKPLAVSMEEARAVQRIYGGRIPLLLNYSRRFLKEFQKLRQEIPHYGSFLKGVGYYGKGILHNGSHMIDFLRFLFGSAECLEVLPTEIHDFDGDKSKDAILKIEDGQFHMIAIDSRIVTIFELELLFEKMRIRILDGGTWIERYQIRESQTYSGYYNYVLSKKESVNYGNAVRGLMEHAADFLEHGKELACTLEDGIRALQLCSRIRGECF